MKRWNCRKIHGNSKPLSRGKQLLKMIHVWQKFGLNLLQIRFVSESRGSVEQIFCKSFEVMSQCTAEVNWNRIVNRKSRWNWNREKTGCCQWNPWVYCDWCCCTYVAVPLKNRYAILKNAIKTKIATIVYDFITLFPSQVMKIGSTINLILSVCNLQTKN